MNAHETSKTGQPRPGGEGMGGDARRKVNTPAAGFAGLVRLEAAVAAEGRRLLPPVEQWNPPYCGDIGLAIARDGTWSYRGSPIRRISLVKLFASVLRRDADGKHYLVTPVEKVDVAVEDAPLLAVEMDVAGTGRAQTLVMRTNLDDVVRVGREHPLRFAQTVDGAIKPYVRVRGRIEALATRALTYDLAELLAEDDTGRVGLWSEGVFFAFGQGAPHRLFAG